MMKLEIARIVLVLCASVSALATAEPSQENVEAAKAAYFEGKGLHDGGKLVEAAAKFKQAYRLSRNPVLLYNIALTLDEASQRAEALFYYRQFLSDAPADATQRATASARVRVLEKEKLDADLGETTPSTEPKEPAGSTPAKAEPSRAYTASDCQHQPIDEAPPNKPLDVTAYVPQDSGFSVTLYYRSIGDSTYLTSTMRWRYKELVARIPAAKLTGKSLQYYVEVKDRADKVVTRWGKPTDPNVVIVDAGAPARFDADVADAASETTSNIRVNEGRPAVERDRLVSDGGFTDVGSRKFEYTKWTTTAIAGGLVAVAIATYVMTGQQEANIMNDSTSCGTPPCRQFDHQYDQAFQDAGKQYATISNITLGVGIATGALAGYLWYRDLTASNRAEVQMGAKQRSSGHGVARSWLVAPSFGESFAGATAVGRF